MTAPKSSTRGVRGGAGGAIKRLSPELVADLEQFFRGENAGAWCLLLPGYERCREEIGERWAAWKAEHPSVRAPAGFDEWIDAPEQP